MLTAAASRSSSMAAASLCSSSRTTLRRSRLQALIDRQSTDVSGYHAHARYVAMSVH